MDDVKQGPNSIYPVELATNGDKLDPHFARKQSKFAILPLYFAFQVDL